LRDADDAPALDAGGLLAVALGRDQVTHGNPSFAAALAGAVLVC
jgi:hypothetical protein